MGPWQHLRRALFYNAVPTLIAQGDAVVSADGRIATLAVYAHSYLSPVGIARWPDGGVQTDDREGLDIYTVDVTTGSLRKVVSWMTDRRLFRIELKSRPVWFAYRRGLLHYVVVEGHGPYGTLRHVADGDVPKHRLLFEVDTHSGGIRELDEATYAEAVAGAESLRLGPYGRMIWSRDLDRWVDRWGPFRQIGDRHVRSLRAPDSGQTVEDTVMLFVHEDPTQWDRPADPVEIARIDTWPPHRR